MENIKQIIQALEEKLLDKKVRSSRTELEKIISKEFIEFGSSGKIFSYSDTINSLLTDNEEFKYNIIEMNVKKLSENIVLVLYLIEIEKDNCKIKTNRSSIWKKEEDSWKIIFHQGTKALN